VTRKPPKWRPGVHPISERLADQYPATPGLAIPRRSV